MKIRPVGAEFFQAGVGVGGVVKDGQTDITKLIVNLSNFANAPNKDSFPTAQSTLSVLTESQFLNSVGKYQMFSRTVRNRCNTTTRN